MKLYIGCLDAYKQALKHLKTIDPFTGKTVKFKSEQEVRSWIGAVILQHIKINFSLHSIGKIHKEMLITQSNESCVMTSIGGAFYYLLSDNEINELNKLPKFIKNTEIYLIPQINKILKNKYGLDDILKISSYTNSFSFLKAKELVKDPII